MTVSWDDYQPSAWCVVFNTKVTSWWGHLVPGRFKHVRAYAFVPKTNLWLFYDVNFFGIEIVAIPGDQDDPVVKAAIMNFLGPDGSSVVVGMRKRPSRRRIFPWSNWCTSALRHLLNLPGSALRPSAFYRDCLKHGGTPFEAHDGRAEVSATSD